MLALATPIERTLPCNCLICVPLCLRLSVSGVVSALHVFVESSQDSGCGVLTWNSSASRSNPWSHPILAERRREVYVTLWVYVALGGGSGLETWRECRLSCQVSIDHIIRICEPNLVHALCSPVVFHSYLVRMEVWAQPIASVLIVGIISQQKRYLSDCSFQ